MRNFDAHAFTHDLIEMLARMSNTPPSEISLDDDLREDIGLDSLQSMDLLARMSERWEVDVKLEDMMDVKKVHDVVDFMMRLSRERAQGQ